MKDDKKHESELNGIILKNERRQKHESELNGIILYKSLESINLDICNFGEKIKLHKNMLRNIQGFSEIMKLCLHMICLTN